MLVKANIFEDFLWGGGRGPGGQIVFNWGNNICIFGHMFHDPLEILYDP